MARKTVGIAIPAPNSKAVLENIQRAEELGIPAAWLTSGGAAGDAMTLLAVAAAQTKRILLGTSIIQLWVRHPITAAQQACVIANVAPGRFRLGIGPSHRQGMEASYGVKFQAPLGHLREYIRIVKALLQKGAVDLDGQYYKAHSRLAAPVDVPVMASALRPASFELCGEEADGAISWVCPFDYLKNVAMPALKSGASKAGRPTPPMIVHAPVSVHENVSEVRSAVREQLGYFPRSPFYAAMFAEAGFANAPETGWTDAMLDAVVISGDEKAVARRINDIFAWGASEVLATVVGAGRDKQASSERALKALASIAAA